MTWVWLLTLGLPVLLALSLLPGGRPRAAGLALAPAAALPALALALWPPQDVTLVPWLVLGTHLGLDTPGRFLLFLTALLWTLAALYARAYLAHDPRRHRFFVFYLLTMAGNLGLVVALDAAAFYTFFALMTFAAYGLVVHEASPRAFRAGRVYIAMAVMGEGLLLSGFLLATQAAAGDIEATALAAAIARAPARDLIIALLLAGFGVKASLLPLHVWLPLAHPVAPTPASAVLSGAMIKAGLLGWLRFLPLGEVALPGWGAVCMAAGAIAAFYGVAFGLAQRDPKTTLAYSSISQMGYMTIALGVALAVEAEAATVALVGAAVYALHHGLAKGALFLGVGAAAARHEHRWQAWLATGGLAFSALALVGAPLTSGAVAKGFLKIGTALAPGQWPQLLDWLLPLAAVGTGLLMGRFLWQVLPSRATEEPHSYGLGLWLSWAALLLAALLATWLLPSYYVLEVAGPQLIQPAQLWASAWPAIAALILAWSAWRWSRHGRPLPHPTIPAGDLLALLELAIVFGRHASTARLVPAWLGARTRLAEAWHAVLPRQAAITAITKLERRLARWDTTGLLLLAVIAALFVLLVGR